MKQVMTQEEVCQYLDISKDTLLEWRKHGLAYSKVGNRIFYKAEWISDFLDENEQCDYRR
ncbi:helix-turn-helix domain-containing protein [Microaceticoccus formicicus]|uniref:helix-turn-helix domain-containing protein n=1 Tax=Microaceticoccus formicicus TaxID=3118105 RepID=UPI003CD04381|nr:helix-turn-helix domain-containing protein [Peptoniphilaceae bacterium AMB_02]